MSEDSVEACHVTPEPQPCLQAAAIQALPTDTSETATARETSSVIRIQSCRRAQLARRRVGNVRAARCLLLSQTTAMTILQKWHHIAKINLRIRRVTANKAVLETQAAQIIQCAARAYIETKIISWATKERY